MSAVAKFENLKELIVELRGQSVLLDSDVAELCKVETKRINEAVKNNPDKFPAGYIIELDKTEWDGLKSKFSTSTKGGKVKLPSAFPEKGLYMPPSSKVRRQFRLPWQSSRLSQKSDSYQEAFRSYRLLKIKLIRRHSCREAEN
jgi:hypothetical protein